jgi:hypothetical protein
LLPREPSPHEGEGRTVEPILTQIASLN